MFLITSSADKSLRGITVQIPGGCGAMICNNLSISLGNTFGLSPQNHTDTPSKMSLAFLPWFLFPTKKTVKGKAAVTHPWWCDCWSRVREGVGITAHCVWEEWWKLMVLHTRPVMHDVLLSFRGSFGMTSHLSVREGLPEWICTWKGVFLQCVTAEVCVIIHGKMGIVLSSCTEFLHIEEDPHPPTSSSCQQEELLLLGVSTSPAAEQASTVTRDVTLAAFLSFSIWELPIGFPSCVNLISAHSLLKDEASPWEAEELGFPQASLVQCL